MPTYTGTAGNDSWTVVNPGTFTLDGLGGIDTMFLGTSLRSSYNITQTADGAVHVDTVSGASGVLRATLLNMEKLVFNSQRDTLDLGTYFGDKTAPTVKSINPASQSTGVAVGSDITVTFSEAIQRGTGSISLSTASGVSVASYDAATSSNLSITGATLSVNPSADLAAGTSYVLTFSAGNIKDLAGNNFGANSYGFTTAILAMSGSAGNDVFTALAGHQSIDGLAGTDALQLNLALSAFTLAPKGAGVTVTANDGSATYDLSNIERLNFSDKSVALDTAATQAGGQTELLLGAVLGKTLLATKAPLIGAVIALFDQGYTFQTLSGAIMRLPIWDILTGQATPTSSDIASYLLTRVNGVAPDPASLASAIAALNAQADMAHGQGDFLWQLAASTANQIQVDLVGLAATGIIYGGV